MGRKDFSVSAHLKSNSANGSPISAYPFTMAAWAYMPSGSSTRCIMSFCNSGLTLKRNAIYVSGTNLIGYLDNSPAVSHGGWSNSATWRFAALSCTSSTSRFLRTDLTETTSTTTKPLGTIPDRWGVGIFCDSTPSSPFGTNNGIAEACMWDIALTSAECDTIFNNFMSPALMRPESLVAYAPLTDRAADNMDYIGGRDLEESGVLGYIDHPPLMVPRRSWTSGVSGSGGGPPAGTTVPVLWSNYYKQMVS